jgi:uncharacterized damage-inducible protein DinB
MDPKATLQLYLQRGREALLWKLEGLGEYDLHRPMTYSGTNLLGVVKHVASVEAGYLGDCFGRPFDQKFPWFAPDAEPNADFIATEESEAIIDLYHRVWRHSDATVAALGLDATGEVPWWPTERRTVSLQQILVHLIAETNRHAGHMDIVRELLDNDIGLSSANDNLPEVDWETYRARVQEVADGFR